MAVVGDELVKVVADPAGDAEAHEGGEEADEGDEAGKGDDGVEAAVEFSGGGEEVNALHGLVWGELGIVAELSGVGGVDDAEWRAEAEGTDESGDVAAEAAGAVVEEDVRIGGGLHDSAFPEPLVEALWECVCLL